MKSLFVSICLCFCCSIVLVFGADISIHHDKSFSVLKHSLRAFIVKSGKADISIKITGKNKNEESIITYHCLTPDANMAHPWHNKFLKLESDLDAEVSPHIMEGFILYHLKVDCAGALVGKHANLEKLVARIRLQARTRKICVIFEISNKTKISSVVVMLNQIIPFCAERFLFVDWEC
jgi:hypothetical protein